MGTLQNWAAAGAARALPAPRGLQPQDTIIIFDWDDTLMCSSAINANQFPAHQHSQLEALLEQVLTASMRLGETCIVTNADELWVLESTRRFAPRVLPLLSQMAVVSARRKYEHAFPGDVFAWKRETFREVLNGRRSISTARAGVNLIVLGDSPAEMEAAQTATLSLPSPLLIKTVKFKETPSSDDLLEQLRLVLQELTTIVTDEHSSCRNLVYWMRPSIAGSMTTTFGGSLAYNQFVPPAPYSYSQHVLPPTYLSTPMVFAAGQ